MNVQIEGSTVEELLARVADEFGPEARIVAADRIRRGGVGGFFTRERYEMTVAVDDVTGQLSADDRVSADDMLTRAVADHDLQTREQLAAAAMGYADEEAGLPRVLSTAGPARTYGATAGRTFSEPAPQSRWESIAASPPIDGDTLLDGEPAPAAVGRPVSSLLDLAEAVSASERRPAADLRGAGGDDATDTGFRTSAPPSVSTEDPGFAAVLTRLSASLAATPGSTVPDTPASLFAAPVEYEPVIDPQRPAALLVPDVGDEETLAPVRRRRSASRRTPARQTPARQTRARQTTAQQAPTRTTPARTTAKPDTPKPRAKVEAAVPRTVQPRRAPAPVPTRQDRPHRAPGGLAASLVELGLPAEYLPAGRGELMARLVQGLQGMPAPQALPITAGEVVVVIGDGTAALAVARQIAARMRLDDSAVHLAAPNDLGTRMPASRLVTDRQRAARQRLVWATKSHPVVVALDAPLGPSAAENTAQLLRALSPSAIVAVTPATAKSGVLAAWLDRLPFTGAPMSLAVIDADATSDPAAVLGLGIPVESVDGRPSDALAWATLLAGRLES